MGKYTKRSDGLNELERKSSEYEKQFRHGTLSTDEKATFGKLSIKLFAMSTAIYNLNFKINQ